MSSDAAAVAAAERFFASLPTRPVATNPSPEQLAVALGGDLPEHGESPEAIVEKFARDADPGIVASQGGRYFGFVVGGALPSAVAADWLVSAWDQNAGFYVLSPASAVIEEIAGRWVLELLGLPGDAAVGFVTGCQMANFTGLAAARHRVLASVGWDVGAQGLIGAPPVRVLAGAEAHGTIPRALAMLGLGRDCIERVAVDANGAIDADAFAQALATDDERPTIVCAQAGNVDTGAFDPLQPMAELCRARSAWLHVDGAFGLWAAASPTLAQRVAGAELADSLATDAHKWLNVPYDCGIVIVQDREALAAATAYQGAYLVRDGERRDGSAFSPESSRRARATPVYAAICELGRAGVTDLVDRCCAHARRFAKALRAGGFEVLNDVVLNQVLLRAPAPEGRDPAEFTAALIARIQADGTCWLGGTTWRDIPALRISVSGWRTTTEDVDMSVEAILRCLGEELGG